MNIEPKFINHDQLTIELSRIGINSTIILQNNDGDNDGFIRAVWEQLDDGSLVDPSEEVMTIVNSHSAVTPQSDSEYIREYHRGNTTPPRQQEILEIMVGLKPRERVSMDESNTRKGVARRADQERSL